MANDPLGGAFAPRRGRLPFHSAGAVETSVRLSNKEFHEFPGDGGRLLFRHEVSAMPDHASLDVLDEVAQWLGHVDDRSLIRAQR